MDLFFLMNEAQISLTILLLIAGYGMDPVKGKDKLQSFFTKDGPDKIIEQNVHNLISEGNTLIADGTIITERKRNVETLPH